MANDDKKEDATMALPAECDYLVIGGGATGMAFCDSLLHGLSSANTSTTTRSAVKVVLVDQHPQPGGQWNDSYSFVQLHQPSDMYGVESERLEPSIDDGEEKHRATRQEILEYYQRVVTKLQRDFDFRFVGGVGFDMQQLTTMPTDKLYNVSTMNGRTNATIKVHKKVVDARYLQPDLPVHIPPKFGFDASKIACVPVNDLGVTKNSNNNHFVVIGGGKTGMDAVVYLLTKLNIPADNVTWVVPHEAWITAREHIGSCMDFLHACASLAKRQPNLKEYVTSKDFFQNGFLKWEHDGHVYRMTNDEIPTKFKDATLSKPEMTLLQSVTSVIRQGRVTKILDNGSLEFEDGTSYQVPSTPEKTLYIHCSAGAFNYSYNNTKPPPIFDSDRIVLQDVYGTPGFCFVGSLLGKLESLPMSDDDEKNAMCLAPTPSPSSSPLGPSGGDIGCLTRDHGLVQRLLNLQQWLQRPELRDWLVGHRLFNLRHKSVEDMERMVDETVAVLEEAAIL
jgi:hypothetical protein